jgi:hypothetical protein
MTLPDHSSLSEVFTSFKGFLQACGYCIDIDDTIEIIDGEESEDLAGVIRSLRLQVETLEDKLEYYELREKKQCPV